MQIENRNIKLAYPLRASKGMTDTTIDLPLAPPGVFAETRTGRELMGIVDLHTMATRSDARGALRFAIHLACIATTGALVWLVLPHWYLLVPAMLLHGTTLVTMFAPMHECTHRTAFASPRLNDAVGWVAGVLSFYNSTFYRYFHAWHHRYTQDLARDPELMFPARQYPSPLSERDQHDRVLVSAHGGLRAARAWHRSAALYAGQRAAQGSDPDFDPVAHLSRRGRRDRPGVHRAALFRLPTVSPGDAADAGVPHHRAYAVQP